MKKIIFITGFLLVLSASALSKDNLISEIEIVNPDGKISSDEILKVIPIHKGDIYSPEKVDVAISYLRKWGHFQEVGFEQKANKDGIHLKLFLKEGSIISGINIRGTYPFLSARTRRIVTVHSGDLYDEKKSMEQTDKLDAFYERHGFEKTEVGLKTDFNAKKRTVDLNYRVKKGKRYSIKDVRVVGNTVFPHGYFISQINPLIPYQPSRLRKSLNKIRKDYQKKGYLRARVRLIDLGKDDSSNSILPTIEISEGKLAHIQFQGTHRISKKTLKKILPVYTEGDYSSYEIDASIKALIDYYHRRGFQEVVATSETHHVSETELIIRFIVKEGPQTRVKKINIRGNHIISDSKIKKGLATKEQTLSEPGYYQPRLVDQDFEKLPQLLKGWGFLDNKFDEVDNSPKVLNHEIELSPLRDKAIVTFNINEGQIYRISKINFVGNSHFSSAKLKKRLALHEGNAFEAIKVGEDKLVLSTFYSNNGFPHAFISASFDQNSNGQGELTYHIEEGTQTRVGEILVVGNERTDKMAVDRAMQIHRGQMFSYQKILDSEAALRRSGSFRSVNIQTIGLTENEPEVHLVVKLEEYRKVLLDTGVTFNTDDSFTGDLTLSQINLFGTIRRANLKLIGGRDIQRGELLFRDPFFIGYPFDISLNINLERTLRPGFKTVEGGGSLNLLREFNTRATFLGRYQLIRTTFFDVTDSTAAEEEDHTTSKFSFSFNYDKRDSYVDPQKGYVAFVGFDISNKLIASTLNFLQPKGYIAHYLKLGSRFTLINFAHIEDIEVLGSAQLPINERLFLGGDYTVRGFSQDAVGPLDPDGSPAGGRLLLATSTELQSKLFNELKLAVFLDNGSISNGFSKVGLSSIRHSAGLGLRYVTPIGPLRLDYGIKLDRQAGESFGRLHLAFGYSF